MSTTSSMQRKSERDELLEKDTNSYWLLALISTLFGSRTLKSIYRIDKTMLNELVEDKNLSLLEELGGVDGVARKLRTSTDYGIDNNDKDIHHRRNTFGENTFKSPPKRGLLHFLSQAAFEFNVFILIICGALSLGLGIKAEGSEDGWKDGAGIFIGVVLAILVTALSEYWHNTILEESQQSSKNIKIGVVRGGRQKHIPIFEIVVGDVVCLKPGDQVPAHGLLIEGPEFLKLRLKEARDDQGLSDEGIEMKLIRYNPFLFSRTKVVNGFGRMLVTSVGMDAKRAQTVRETNCDSKKETPLELEAQLEELDWIKDRVGYAITFVVIIIMLARGSYLLDENNEPLHGIAKVNAIVDILVEIITGVIDIANPWLLSLTFTRAYAMMKLRKIHKAMVLKPSSLETLGCATIICTDETGILTMEVDKFYLGQESMEKKTNLPSIVNQNIIKLLCEAIALNTTGSVYSTGSTSESQFDISASPTEKAILSWAVEDLKMDIKEAEWNHDILPIEIFNSDRERSGILTRRKVDNTMQMHWKGAAELILTMCSSYYDSYGNTNDLDHKREMEFKQIIDGMASSSLRCIAFAHKIVSRERFQGANKDEILKEGMILLGVVGISNSYHLGVKKTIKDFQNAGVKIQMITGDDIFSSNAIARECGIPKPDCNVVVIKGMDFRNYTPEERLKMADCGGVAINGEDFENYTREEQKEMADKICVMARASPFHKLLMVQCLKDKGHVVAVTGDNMNYIAAMEAANVGLFMGINQCTEAAKDSYDFIISDGNLASVFKALLWGRSVYSNVQKFVQFQLTVSYATLLAVSIAFFSPQGFPLTAVQLLWVSVVTDSLGTLAFATEKPAKEDMKKPPVPCKTEPIVTNIMLRNILPQILYQVALILTLLHLPSRSLIFGTNYKVKDTFIFNSYVLCQVFNQFNSRKLEKKNILEQLHTSKLFLWIVALTFILQFLFVEFLKRFVDAERLNWCQWGLCVGFAALTLPIGFVARSMYVREKPFMGRMSIKRHILGKLWPLYAWASQVLVGMQRNRRGEELLPVTHQAKVRQE